jgi:hypothetical protein
MPEVEYLGHKVDAEGLHTVDAKVEAIREAPAPANVSELKAYLGMLNYYGKFLPNLSTTLAPLHKLLCKEVKWKWGQTQSEAFLESKKLLHSSRVLVHYDPGKELVLACDASPYGVGAVLSHRQKDGTDKPISYASRSLSPAEKNYSQLDKEALAIIFGVKRYHQYLYGRTFTIYTDHKPLTSLLNEAKAIPTVASPRVMRWALTLSAYEYTIQYREGKAHANADALSRLPLPNEHTKTPLPGDTILLMDHMETTPVKVDQIKAWTRKDPVLSKVLKYVLQGWPHQCPSEEFRPFFTRKNELSVEDHCILWGSRVIIPPPGREAVIKELHETHPGVSRMKGLARSYVWWPKMDDQIEHCVKSCEECQTNRPLPPEAPMHPWEWPGRAWSRLHVDYAGPFMGNMFLILVDSYSKYMDVYPMNSSTSCATIDKLRISFATHGLPETLVSDNGTCFTSEEFKKFVQSNGIKHICSAPYHPRSNGLAEKAVQTFKNGLKKMKKSKGTIKTKVQRFLFHYRCTPHTTTGVSPAEMLFGRRPRGHLDLLHPDLAGRVIDKQENQKYQHDQHAKDRQFQLDDQVYVKNMSPRGPRWVPGKVTSLTGPVSYTVTLSNGVTQRRHQDHLRSYLPAGEVADPTEILLDPYTLPEPPNRSHLPAETVVETELQTELPTVPTVVPGTPAKATPRRNPERDRHPPSRYKEFV